MEFLFIESVEGLTEVEILSMIYNLFLVMSIFHVCMTGYKYFWSMIRKGTRWLRR